MNGNSPAFQKKPGSGQCLVWHIKSGHACLRAVHHPSARPQFQPCRRWLRPARDRAVSYPITRAEPSTSREPPTSVGSSGRGTNHRNAERQPQFAAISSAMCARWLGTPLLQVALAVCLLSLSRTVRASEPVIEWNAPPECPDRDELASQVHRLLGGEVQSNVSATTDVTRGAGLYQARIRIRTAAGLGQRILDNARCDVLAESVALVVALSATPRTVPRLPLAVALSAHASAVWGTLPLLAAGVGATGALEIASVRVAIHGSYFARQTTTFADSTLGASFQLFTLGARGCRIWTLGAFDLAPCVGAEVFITRARGFGGAIWREPTASWWGPALGLFARWPSTQTLSLYLAADGVVPLHRRPFIFSDVGELHRPSIVALRVLVAGEVRF